MSPTDDWHALQYTTDDGLPRRVRWTDWAALMAFGPQPKHELRTRVEEEVRGFFTKGSLSQLYRLISYQYLYADGQRIDNIAHAIQKELEKVTA